MATSPQFVNTPNTACVNYTNADSTNEKTIFTAGANGSRVDAIIITTDDTASKDVIISVVKSSTSYKVCYTTINILTASGVAMTDLLNVIPGVSNLGFILKNGDSLKLNFVNALTSGKTADVIVIGGDF